MYAYISGKLAYKHQDFLVVDAGGIGYKIATSLNTMDKAGTEGDLVKVFTHLHVREDVMSLYGFLTQEELSIFELLLTVSGVGPKAALSILSTVPPSKFGLCVITGDAKSLSKAQGVGLKTAQRIILELKDKLKKEQLTQNAGQPQRMEELDERSRSSEAISALMVLGYTPLEASRAVAAVYAEGMELEIVVREALKGLMR